MDGISLIIYLFGTFTALISLIAVSYVMTLLKSKKADR